MQFQRLFEGVGFPDPDVCRCSAQAEGCGDESERYPVFHVAIYFFSLVF
jgi:hypothetical protein